MRLEPYTLPPGTPLVVQVGIKGLATWSSEVSHTCFAAHCNTEFRLTRALKGDPRTESTDEEGTIVLVVKASRDIK